LAIATVIIWLQYPSVLRLALLGTHRQPLRFDGLSLDMGKTHQNTSLFTGR
jgi:hypothetical protein